MNPCDKVGRALKDLLRILVVLAGIGILFACLRGSISYVVMQENTLLDFTIILYARTMVIAATMLGVHYVFVHE